MRPDFTGADREWLHQLVTDWQVIADLSFADLLLILPMPDGRHVVAGSGKALFLVDTLKDGDKPRAVFNANGDWISPSWSK